MHIFLTGDIQVGKSTIIRKFIIQANLSADGFMTFWDDADNGRSLYISPYGVDIPANERRLLTNVCKNRPPLWEKTKHVFDEYGAEILDNAGKRDVIVMDELGFMESEAFIFQSAVMRHIERAVPVVGVIKPCQSEFLDTIRSHPNVSVFEVTENNRDAAFERLLAET